MGCRCAPLGSIVPGVLSTCIQCVCCRILFVSPRPCQRPITPDVSVSQEFPNGAASAAGEHADDGGTRATTDDRRHGRDLRTARRGGIPTRSQRGRGAAVAGARATCYQHSRNIQHLAILEHLLGRTVSGSCLGNAYVSAGFAAADVRSGALRRGSSVKGPGSRAIG